MQTSAIQEVKVWAFVALVLFLALFARVLEVAFSVNLLLSWVVALCCVVVAYPMHMETKL